VTESNKERMLDLLTDEALFGLDEKERNELRELKKLFPELSNDNSLELTASAIGLTNLQIEPMPDSLRSKILADADEFFVPGKTSNVLNFQPQTPEVETENIGEEIQKTFEFEPKRPFMQWLGWVVAALLFVILAVNVFWLRPASPELGKGTTPTPTPIPLTPSMEREQLLASAKDLVQSEWGDLDPKKPQNVKGDVVWSNSAQKGFVRFRNLPVNDKTKETYQVWIFDENQKQPIDGGVFDANEAGEIIIPIDAKLKVQKPKMFAVTAEKPGGVVVSPLEKVMAVAKVTA
jgi:hypothetical protein